MICECLKSGKKTKIKKNFKNFKSNAFKFWVSYNSIAILIFFGGMGWTNYAISIFD